MKPDPYSDNPLKPRPGFVTVLYKWLKTIKPICEVVAILYAGALYLGKMHPEFLRKVLGIKEQPPGKVELAAPPAMSDSPVTYVEKPARVSPPPETSTRQHSTPASSTTTPTTRKSIADPTSEPPQKTKTTPRSETAAGQLQPWVEQVVVKVALDREHSANRLVMALRTEGRVLAEISQEVSSDAKYFLPLKRHLSPGELNQCWLTVRRDLSLPGPKALLGGITGLGDWKVTIAAKAEGYWAPAVKNLKGSATRNAFSGAWGDETTVRVSALGEDVKVEL